MINFHLIDKDFIGNYTAEFFIEISSENQGLIPEHSDADMECLDDFLDKIEFQDIRVRDNGIAAYIRTAPIETPVQEAVGEEKPKKTLWQRLFGSVEIDAEPKTADNTLDVFGVDFKGLKTKVYGTPTEQGMIYDIFINTPEDNIQNIINTRETKGNSGASFIYLHPQKLGERGEDIRKTQRKLASLFSSLAELYDRLGIKKGNLVFNTTWDDPKRTRMERMKNLHLRMQKLEQGITINNCTFYKIISQREKVDYSEPSLVKMTRSSDTPAVHKKETPQNRGLKTNGEAEITFDDVKGLDDAVARLKNAIKYFEDPEAYRRERGYGLSPGCLLYGQAGTGKTMLAKAFANEAGVKFIEYKASQILSKWHGESDQNLQQLFAEAENYGKCVIFIDEFEQLGRDRTSDVHEVSGRLVDALLTYLDGFSERGGDVYLIGATNVLEVIDRALVSGKKGGRLQAIEIPLPTYESRRAMVKDSVEKHRKRVEVSPFEENPDYDAIARESEGLSGRTLVSWNESILRTLCDRFYDAMDAGENPDKLTTQDWLDEIKKYKPEDTIGFHT